MLQLADVNCCMRARAKPAVAVATSATGSGSSCTFCNTLPPRAVRSLRKAFHPPPGRLRHRILRIRKKPCRTQARLNGVDRVAHLGARLFDL